MNLALTIGRSLIIFTFFLAPLLAYLLLWRRGKLARTFGVAPAFVIVIASISAAALLGILKFSKHWPEATQVVWTGVESDLQRFAVGGPREGAIVGWPNGAFTPSLRVLSAKAGIATLQVAEGGAFTWDVANKIFLGGVALASSEEKVLDGYRVRLTSELQASFDTPLATVAEILSQQGEVLARFNLPATNPRRDRVLPLRSLIEANGARSPGDAERLVIVGKWAADKRLLVSKTGEARLLGTDPYQVKCTLPCDLTLFWAGQRIPLRVGGNEARISLTFLPPWRVASPLPPQPATGDRRFTLTATPRPDDVAFVVPLGHAIYDNRADLAFGQDKEGRPVFKGPQAIVGTGPSATYLPSDAKPPPNKTQFAANITSSTSVLFDRTAFLFATVNDLPSPSGVALLLGLALITYVFGVVLIGARSPDPTTRRAIYALSACLWNLLVFRLLLALRFAIDPSRLDDLTVKGVTLALSALSVMPGLFLLWARLRADLNLRLLAFASPSSGRDEKLIPAYSNPGYVRSMVYLFTLVIVFFIEFQLTPQLWSNPPTTPSLKLAAPFVLLAIYLFLVTNCVHRSYVPSLRRSLRWLFIVPLRFDAVLARRGKSLWAQFAHEPKPEPISTVWWLVALGVTVIFVFVAARLQPAIGALRTALTVLALIPASLAILWCLTRLVHRALGKLVAAVVIFLFLPLLARTLPGSVREIVQEVIALFVLGLIPALFWLSLALVRRRPGQQISWSRLIFLAITAVLLPAFVMPKFLGDMGSTFATIPLFAAVAAVLFLTPGRRATAVILGMLICGVLLAGLTYRHFSSWLPGAAEVRLVTYWQGSEIERLIPWARATRGGEGMSLQSLRDAYQHGWENRAIAHEAGWWGLGYGNAPTQLSQVRQDTIQFDSLFSFFIAGEHGWVGAVSLFLLFSIPLAVVCVGAWETRTDFGYAGAIIILAWLFLEALLHAGMNLGTFPFTGRGMPLVNVNSTSDLLRWFLLFAFAAQLLQWRDPDGETERTPEDIASITSNSEGEPTAQPLAEDSSNVIDQPKGKRLRVKLPPRSRRALAAIALALLPFLVVSFSHGRLIIDKDFPRTFEWAGVLERVREMIRDEVLTVNQQTGIIEPDWKKLPGDFNVPDGALLKQEILRFNALPLAERLDEQATGDYRNRLRRVGNAAAFDRLLEDLRLESLTSWRDIRPGLFRLLPPERQTDGIEVRAVGGYRLTTNSAFNSRFSFSSGVSRSDIPRVTFTDGQTLIGPAWVDGRWIAAFAPEHSVPWTMLLARTLTVEQNCFGRGRVNPCEATLTLDRVLHEATTGFISAKGRKGFEELLDTGTSALDSQALLPPRAALAVLSLPGGETLALGGYPRMTSSPYWQHAAGSGDWLPPSRWVEQQAPDALRSLYGGDRNFDRIVVGSATKPLWAAAALGVHPRLNEQLKVRGPGDTESAVFGIPLTSGWHVTPRSDWVDFSHYLALSDNRYHVRLGFLGLAEDAGNDVRSAGDSSSNSESLRLGAPGPWAKYPMFSPLLQFSQQNPNSLANLSRTPLAENLERMFAVNPGGKPLGARVSFWTKNEEEDLASRSSADTARSADVQGAPLTAGFVPISPVAPNLRLDGITNPRDYVSLLLGGRTNLWSNVDLAAAFVTSITGKPFAAHIIRDERPFHYAAERQDFTQTARKLRPGLESVVRDGTFYAALMDQKQREFDGARALTVLNNLARTYSIYAKTGTLQTRPNDGKGRARYTSRVVLAIVQWDDKRQQSVRSGLVFSLIAEVTDEGNASRWLAQFLVKYEKEIRILLQPK